MAQAGDRDDQRQDGRSDRDHHGIHEGLEVVALRLHRHVVFQREGRDHVKAWIASVSVLIEVMRV